jgi:voltage-dependent calcium channel alpha-2/delta-3
LLRDVLCLQLASDGIKREFTQGLFDQANYTFEKINGDQLVQKVKTSLSDYFIRKREAAQVCLFRFLHR